MAEDVSCDAIDWSYKTMGSSFKRICMLRNIVFSMFIDVEVRIKIKHRISSVAHQFVYFVC